MESKEIAWQSLINHTATPDLCSEELQMLREDLAMLMEILPPRDRETLEMYFWERLSEGEIAKVQGVTQPAISKRIWKAINLMKKCLELYREGKIISTSGFCHLGHDILVYIPTAGCITFCWLEHCPWKQDIREAIK